MTKVSGRSGAKAPSGHSPKGGAAKASPAKPSVPNAKLCGWCLEPRRIEFYKGARKARCGCSGDWRTPIEIRRDAVLDKYGDDPAAYTPAVLKKLAEDGLLDLTDAFCPAGKLSLEHARRREQSSILRDGDAR